MLYICCGAVYFVPVKPHVPPLQLRNQICILNNFHEKFGIQIFFGGQLKQGVEHVSFEL